MPYDNKELAELFGERTLIFSGTHAEVADSGSKMCVAYRESTISKWSLTELGEELVSSTEVVKSDTAASKRGRKPKVEPELDLEE